MNPCLSEPTRKGEALNFSFIDPWHDFLPRECGHVIGLCGSGGKTSLMIALSALYKQEGVPLILTTTTRTEPLVDVPVADVNDPDAVGLVADEPAFFLHSGIGPEDTWLGLDPEAVDQLVVDHPDRLILVEVDGAGKHPVKYYRPGEPVWPSRTSLALVVMGLSAFGETARESVFRFGVQEFEPLVDLDGDTEWTWEHYESVLTGSGGYLDQVPAEVPVLLTLVGMGDLADSIGLFDFMGKIMTHPRIPVALFCETTGQEPSFRTVCRIEENSEPPAPDDDGRK